jgi:cell division transport system ATP-binding protein
MLIRDEAPSSGKIFFNDIDITRISRRKIYKLRREIGVIFQDFKLVQDKTAFENVAFAMEAAGKKNKEIKEAVPYVLDIVGLAHRMDAFPRQLSGGEQQRVAIARAIANNPKILIADEPTGNLDPASAWDIVQVLTKINNWGTTVIMSTHGTDIVNSLNKRVIQMEAGKIVRDDSKGQYELTSKTEEEALKDEVVSLSQEPKKKKLFQVKIPSTRNSEEQKIEEVVNEEKKEEEAFEMNSESIVEIIEDSEPQNEEPKEEELTDQKKKKNKKVERALVVDSK